MPIDLILGGYQLAGKAMEERIAETVSDLSGRIQPRVVGPRTLHGVVGQDGME
jgi:hypothetical protein